MGKHLYAAMIFTLLAGCAPQDPAEPADSPAFSELGGKADGASLSQFAVKDALPIVLHHGFNASPDSEWGWNERIKTTLEGLGHKVFISQVNPYQSPTVRAPELEAFIAGVLRQTGAKQVHLIAHSQGGLDARFLVSPMGLNRADMVRSVTTISTPHHGTNIADVGGGFTSGLIDLLSSSEAVDLISEIMAKAGLNQLALQYDFDLDAALGSMAETKIEQDFNALIPLDENNGVYRQSVAGVSSVGGIANSDDIAACQVAAGDELAAGTLKRLQQGAADWMTASLVGVAAFVAHGFHKFPNDGVVRVSSSRWGRFRGCVLADHMGVVGQGRYAGAVDADTGFDIYTFYAQLAAELAREHQAASKL